MSTQNKPRPETGLGAIPTRVWIRFALAAFLLLFPASYGIRVAVEIQRAEPYLAAADARQRRAEATDDTYGDAATIFDGDPVDGQLLYWPTVVFGGMVLSLMIFGGAYLLWSLVYPWPLIGAAAGALALGLVWIPPFLGHHVIDGVSSYL